MGEALTAGPLRRAFAKRLHEVVDYLAETADQATVEEALGMADAFSGLALAMQRVANSETAAVRDPLAAARVRAVVARKKLIERSGGLLRLSEAAARLGVTRQAVRNRRSRDTILSVQMPNGEWVYPAVQFAEHGLVPGIDTFVRAFVDADPWSQLAVLLSPSSRFGGKTALELLREGKHAEAESIATSYGEQG